MENPLVHLFHDCLPRCLVPAGRRLLLADLRPSLPIAASGSFDFQGRSKTKAVRTKVAQEVYKELQNARQEALQRKKARRRKMMEEAESKLNTEALRRRETKERARQLKKAMPKIKMSRGA